MRIAVTMLALVLTALFVSSCSAEIAVAEDAGPLFKIGQLSMGPSSFLSQTEIGINRQAVVDAGGGVLLTEPFDSTPQSMLQAVDRLIEQGCAGIILTPDSDTALPLVAQHCEEAGVYWVVSMRPVNNPSIQRQLEQSPYYIGTVMENDEEAGYYIVQQLAESGCQKIAVISISKLNAAAEARERGMFRSAKDHGVEIAAEIRNMSTAEELQDAVQTLLEAHPDLDAIFSVASSAQRGTIAILETLAASQRDVKFASIDFSIDMLPYFEDGSIVVAAGGHTAFDSSIATALLVNAVTGNALGEDNESLSYTVGYRFVHNPQELEAVFTVSSSPLLSQDTIRTRLLRQHNPQLTQRDFEELLDSYNSGLPAP